MKDDLKSESYEAIIELITANRKLILDNLSGIQSDILSMNETSLKQIVLDMREVALIICISFEKIEKSLSNIYNKGE